MLRAATRDAAGVLAALRAGQFYASSGPTIGSLERHGTRLRVRCSPATAVYWQGRAQYGWSVHADPGRTLTEVELELDHRAGYFRVEVVDAHGRVAWSPAYTLEP
jgi:hypothetical protein